MHSLVVLVDVDHTLLEGDAVRACIAAAVSSIGGEQVLPRFWELYELIRAELGGIDVPETASRLEREFALPEGAVVAAIDSADFSKCLYEGAEEALRHLGGVGLTVVLSDGDLRFQRQKVVSSGIAALVDGRVLIVPHKEREFEMVERTYPGEHYALLDDRATILSSVKAVLGKRVTTVLVRQGRYLAEAEREALLAPDLAIDSIRDVPRLDARALIEAAR